MILKSEKEIVKRIFNLENEIDELMAYKKMPKAFMDIEINQRRQQIKALQWVLGRETQ